MSLIVISSLNTMLDYSASSSQTSFSDSHITDICHYDFWMIIHKIKTQWKLVIYSAMIHNYTN